MKKKITIPEHEWNDPAGGWQIWKTGEIRESDVAGKMTWGWVCGNAFITKWEHDFDRKVYEIEYIEMT